MHKSIAFVPVRLSSSRLPEKHLRTIGDRALLSWVLKRLKDSREIDSIVVCAPDEPKINILNKFTQQEKVDLFIYKGDVNDVVGRLTAAAKQYNADICLLASGDCPLLSTSTIDNLISPLKQDSQLQMVTIAGNENADPIHEGIFVARRTVWELADNHSDTKELREHQFPIIYVYPELFKGIKKLSIIDQDIYYKLKHRISVDTPSDLEFMNKLYAALMEKNIQFQLDNAIEYLLKNPRLLDINKTVHQKKLYEKSYKVMLFVTAAGKYGFGNLTRTMEIARILIDNFGFGVEFIVLESEAKKLLEQKKYKAFLQEEYDLNGQKTNLNFDIIIFDIQKDYEITERTINKLHHQKKAVLFIDNLKNGANIADLIIIPTAHYTGEELANLKHGKEYVVIRKEVQEAKALVPAKKKGLLIYRQAMLSQSSENFKMYLEQFKDMSIENIDSFTFDFPEKLARSKFFMAPLGISAYEAFYLGTNCHLIPGNPHEEEEINKFYESLKGYEAPDLEMGAENIAREIVSLALKYQTN